MQTGNSLDCGFIRCHTQASSASINNHLAMNISCPEFVPRWQKGTTHQYADASSQKHVFGSGNAHPVTSLNGRAIRAMSGQYVAADGFVYSAGGNDARSEHLPEHFANVAIGQRRQSAPWSFSRRDASTQTAKVDMVNACVGNFTMLLVDASTNTPHHDETLGLQRQTNPVNITTQNECGNIQNVGRLLETVGTGLETRLSPSTTASDRWADGWKTAAESVDTECKSSDASKNFMPALSATNNIPLTIESSGLRVNEFSEVCNTGTKSSSLSSHEVYGSCECSFSNCPFASSTQSSSMHRNVHEHSTDASGHERGHETMRVNIMSSFQQFINCFLCLNESIHTHTQSFYCSSGICLGPPG